MKQALTSPYSVLSGLSVMGWLAGCAGVIGAATLQIDIQPWVGRGGLVLQEVVGRTPAEESWSVTRLSYLISGVALQQHDGSWLSLPETVAWLDAAAERQAVNLPNVPPGKYQAVRFHVGLSAEDDARDPASHGPDDPLNPRINGLHWSWQGGYIFMALEGKWRGKEGGERGFAYHLGRGPFRTAVVLPCALELKEAATIRAALDVTSILSGLSFRQDGTTTHSREGDPLALRLKSNLEGAFRLLSVEEGSSPAPPRDRGSVAGGTPLQLEFGPAFPQPKLPSDNPLTKERAALGRMLFNEKVLSRDNTLSCASCHDTRVALTDPERFSTGVDGRVGDRNAMPLFNLAWKESFFWDGRAASLREQALIPIEDHREMDETVERVLSKLEKQERYPAAFQKAFGTPDITAERLGMAVENFLLTLTSHDSKFDRSQRGEETLTADEQRGFELFMMEREPRLGTMGADCFHCHGGALFTDHQFRNNGLPINPADTGRHRVTGVGLDRGTFATPSLRNIALTAPYMHDGRFSTLEEVMDHYSEGVERTPSLDPNLAKHPDGGLDLSAEDKRCVIAFLRTLTDNQFAEKALPESE